MLRRDSLAGRDGWLGQLAGGIAYAAGSALLDGSTPVRAAMPVPLRAMTDTAAAANSGWIRLAVATFSMIFLSIAIV
ncbi:hypothetical protein [Pseudoduganella armeniaca]|uniref:hypothetical protein n=1 Tax=Pseudoduganella armeniaca TaxID=2072590 RepID=UPI000D151283|nr:hypothetical protein [Pseudoduganella armeniaca]